MTPESAARTSRPLGDNRGCPVHAVSIAGEGFPPVMFAAPVFHRRKRSDAFCEWITAFSQAMAEYDYGMIKTSLNVDLMRLRQFLKALESDAQIALADVDLGGHEIEILKHEIAEIEGVLNGSPDHGSRAFLFRIPIDYSTHRVHGV